MIATRTALRRIKLALHEAPAPVRDSAATAYLAAHRAYLKINDRRTNEAKTHNDLPVPPQSMRVTVVGYSDLARFLETGQHDTTMVREAVKRAGRPPEELGSLLEWGCGCGRLLRWWQDIASTTSINGCDYNRELVQWTDSNLPFVNGAVNSLKPPLPYEAGTFDLVYAISVFTHLTDEMSAAWLTEISRVLGPGGLFFFSSHGISHREKMLPKDVERFDAGESVVHFASTEGTNLCSAFHPRSWLEKLIADTGLELIEVCEAHTLSAEERDHMGQDRYLVRKA